MDNLRLYITTFYRDRIKRYLTSLDKEQQEKLAASLYVILTLFTISFFGIFAINPTLSTISALKKQHDDYKVIDNKLRMKINSLTQLDASYQQLTQSLLHLDQAFPKLSEIPSFTRKIETIALNNNLTIVRFNTGNIELFPLNNQPTLNQVSFTINLEGQSQDIRKFLSDIISFDRLVIIDSITEEPKEETKTITISGKIFFKILK